MPFVATATTPNTATFAPSRGHASCSSAFVRCAAIGLGVVVTACGARVEPQDLGAVTQFSAAFQYEVQPKQDFVVLVATAQQDVRTKVIDALRARLAAIAAGEAWLARMNNPVDIRVQIACTCAAVPTTITWREPEASAAAAESVADRAASALRAFPSFETSDADAVMALQALADERRSDNGDRFQYFMLATTDPVLLSDRGRAKEAYVNANGREAPHFSSFIEGEMECVPHPLKRCRLLTYIPPGADCDPARGWFPSNAPRNEDGYFACEVRQLTGSDDETCRREEPLPKATSGWCLPPQTGPCIRFPRLVGFAAPPRAIIEMACDE